MMIYFKFFPLFLVSLTIITLLSGCSSLIKPTMQPTSMTVAQLEEKMEFAMDPKMEYRKATSYIQESISEISTWYSSQELTIRTSFKKQEGSTVGKLRVDYLINNRIFSSLIYANNAAYVVDYKAKKATKIGDEEYKSMMIFVSLCSPDTTYSETFSRIELSECVIDDQNYYVLQCFSTDSPAETPYEVFVNADTFLINRIQTNTKKFGEYSAVIDSYATYQSVTVPDIFTSNTNGVIQDFDLILYNLNANIPDIRFELPKDFTIVEK